jgi:hypothetical protein
MEAKASKIAAAPPGGANGAGADKTLPDPTVEAKWALVGLLLAGLVLSILLNAVGWTTRAFQPAQDATANFALFAGFYVAAQVIERLLEVVSPLLPPWKLPGADEAAKVAHAKADRAAVSLGLATLCGVVASCGFGLYFLTAVGIGVETTDAGTVSNVPHTIDAMVTGLTIGAGTKPLHDLISNIQNKSNPKTGSTVS